MKPAALAETATLAIFECLQALREQLRFMYGSAPPLQQAWCDQIEPPTYPFA